MSTTPGTVVTGAVRSSRRSAARDGVVAMLPFVAGYAPFALAIGASVAAHGDPLAGWAGSWLIFAGSAHLSALRALETSGLLAAVLTGALINARLLVYGTALARRWQAQPLWFRLTAAPLVIDPTWALADARDRRDEADQDGAALADQRRFFVAAGLTLGVGWSGLMAAGALAGDRIGSRHLAVAVPLCLASLVGPRLAEPATRAAVAVAAAVVLLTSGLPAGTGVLLATIAGGVAGATRERPGR